MEHQNDVVLIPQYSLGKILLIWASAAIPMAILGWVVAPALAQNPAQPGFERLAVLTVGLVWQFVLVVFLLYQETGTLRWSTIKPRLWLNTPRSPQSGKIRGRLWWWLIPVILLTAIYEMQVEGPLDQSGGCPLPLHGRTTGVFVWRRVNTPAWKAQLVGAWGVYALFLFQALFNTVLGEELLFRGLLLPRMTGVFGKWDWVMNGLLFGLYHLHQPWVIVGGAIEGILLFALPSRYFRSAWFGIIAHSGQSIFFAILLLGLVLGLA